MRSIETIDHLGGIVGTPNFSNVEEIQCGAALALRRHIGTDLPFHLLTNDRKPRVEHRLRRETFSLKMRILARRDNTLRPLSFCCPSNATHALPRCSLVPYRLRLGSISMVSRDDLVKSGQRCGTLKECPFLAAC
jgi:hypothetical protein